MYGLNKNVKELEIKDYRDKVENDDYEIDCSLGQNPYGCGVENAGEILSKSSDEISNYPHNYINLIKDISKKYENLNISPKNIALSSGSFGAIMTLNRMYLRPSKTVIGLAPQFTATIDDMMAYEIKYDPLYMTIYDFYKIDVDALIKKIELVEEAYVYIDNPNNPTGQTIDKDDLERIISASEKQGSFVLIDEAYGDYMKLENSCIDLVNKYKNLAVVRTFSKGKGMAGARIGYVVSNEEVIKYFNKVSLPFSVSVPSVELAREVLKNDIEKKVVEKANYFKPYLRNNLKNIKMSVTNDDVPICLYYVYDENIDLEEYFYDFGIKTVSCRNYYGLGQNYVRINICSNVEKMIELILDADKPLECGS